MEEWTVAKERDWAWREDLKCGVRRLEYDFTSREGVLFMGEEHCTNMSTCIRLFEGIDPQVGRIRTIAGDREDTEYRLSGGEWIVVDKHGFVVR
jgi:hypothetical protein